MKRQLIPIMVFFVAIIISFGGLRLIFPAQAARQGAQNSVTYIGDIEPKTILVDDYEDGNYQNNLGGDVGCWPGNGGSVDCKMEVIENEGFITMQYDVTPVNSYAVAFSKLSNLNMSNLETIWLVAKGAQGGEPFYVELKDCDENVPKEEIDDYLAQGIDTSEWRAAAIPLSAYVDIADWTCIKELNIIPHYDIGSGQGTIYVNETSFLPARVLVDDFHDVNRANELGGDSGFWNADSGFITYSYPQEVLKLDYDVTISSTAQANYWTKLLNTNLLSQKDVISFRVRGDNGSEELAVEFRDCGLGGEIHFPKVKVSDYLDNGITTNWQTVVIPLAAFADGLDWQCVEHVSFLVSANPWLNSGKGTVFIDDLILEPIFNYPIPLILDTFDDCNQWNALSWAWGGGTNDSGSTIDFDFDIDNRLGERGCGLRIDYNVLGTSGAWLYTEIRGGDVSNYTHLRFWIKGSTGDEELHVYLEDQDGNRRFYEEIKPTKEWREVLIPLDYFSPPVDLTNLLELQIAFEWKPMSGQVYIDNIDFTTLQNYMPTVLKDGQVTCFDTPPSCSAPFNNFEPNNLQCSADAFGLSSNTPIQSYLCAPDDVDDYYPIDVTTLNPITVSLSNIPDGKDYDLYLYFQGIVVAKSDNYGSTDESLIYTPIQTGTYYIRVYPYSGYSLMPYTLQASFQ